jgi:glycosyltransferase involved in cell wall biosynthesis
MMKWAVKNHYTALLLTQKGKVFEKEWKTELERNRIRIVFYEEKCIGFDFFEWDQETKFMWQDYDRVTCIVSYAPEYFVANACRKKMKYRYFQIYFYVIHPLAADYTKLGSVNKVYHKAILEPLFQSGNLVFMDEETRDYYLCRRQEALRHHSGTAPQTACRIVRIGMELKGWDGKAIADKRNSGIFNIMSVCRMEFPFKGYVLGLVDDFSEICREHKKIRLSIIGDGDDMDILRSKIEACSPDVKERIELLGSVPYKELDAYLKTAHILVGMGTTLLHGAAEGIPCVIASSYQTGHYACGMFQEMPGVLGYMIGEGESQRSCFYKEILKVLRLSDSEYAEICRKTYHEYKKNYDINECMKKLLEIQTEEGGPDLAKQMYFKMIRFLIEIKKKARKRRKQIG